MSGGFYKYRCKYFYTHECDKWVYISNSACAACLAAGRDATDVPAHLQHRANEAPRNRRDVMVPYWDDNGLLQYSIVEAMDTDASGISWEVRQSSANHPQRHTTAPTVTRDPPRAPMSASSAMKQTDV